jgi:hypothetical protein
MKLINGLIERKPINDSLIPQILSEVDWPIARHEVSILFNQVYQAFQHFTLRSLDLN